MKSIILIFMLLYWIEIIPQSTRSPENAWVEIYLIGKSINNPSSTTGFEMQALSQVWGGGTTTHDYPHSYTWLSNSYNQLTHVAINSGEEDSGWDFVTSSNYGVQIFGYGLYELKVGGEPTEQIIYLNYLDDRIGYYGYLGNPTGHPIDVWIKYNSDENKIYINSFGGASTNSNWVQVSNYDTIKIWELKGMGSPSVSNFQPFAPVNAVVQVNSNNKPVLNWQHRTPVVDYWVGYEVYRCITTTGSNPINFSKIATTTKYTTNYTDNNLSLSGNQTAYYKIKTKNTNSLSDFSNQVSFTLNLAPSAPQNLDVTSNGTHPEISWDQNNEPDLDGYYLYKSVNNGSFYHTASLNENDTSWIDTEVTFTKPIWSVKIEYKAKAYDTQSNFSPFSNSDYIYGKDNPLPKQNSQDSITVEKNIFINNINNYPNPFNPSTTIKYELSHGGFVKIDVYNSLGQKVRVLVEKYQQRGAYTVEFNAIQLPSGIYYYKIESGSFIKTMKMLLLK